ncbi:hypothetical protein [Pelistega ratti]|uniref:hypothetical protein n=1 Tax=Pelistega ratti TaxID=2652177 RepID=UPI0013577A9A|nr:hypothetical protein [Pelistega ratti]
MNRVGRPLGVIASAVIEALSQQNMTAVELAERLQVSVQVMKSTCRRLVVRKQIRVVGKRQMRAAKPLFIYALIKPLQPNKMREIIWGTP